MLPEEIDAEAIEAHVEHGMLTLMLPVHARMKPRRVEVRVGGQEMKSVGSSSQGEGAASQGNGASSQGNGTPNAQGASAQETGT